MKNEKQSIQGTINAVPFQQAMEMTERWQQMINPNTNAPYPKSYTFSAADFMEILNEPGVVHVRIYPCVEADGSVNLLAVGADRDNVDIIHENSEASGIYNFATPCPNTCGTSPLNHGE